MAGLYGRFFKRTLDIVVSACALLILSPVLLVVAGLVRVKLGSPVFFSQMRPGKDEVPFRLYKFRTMAHVKDVVCTQQDDEVRLGSFGRFLRSTSLDELPELWNVLRGEMSIVGPRPLLMRYLPYYREEERERSKVRPGITGQAQVGGRNALTWDERFQADVEYITNLSFALDIKIIVATLVTVLTRKDVLAGSQHVMQDLDVERRGELIGAESR